MVDKYTGHPMLVDLAAKLIKRSDVPARDERALARVVQEFSQEHIKYFREYPERFQSPMRTLQWRIGDCDDKTILVASTLRSFRIPVRLKFLRLRIPAGTVLPTGEVISKNKRAAHVYPQALLDNQWESLDSVRQVPLGHDVEEFAVVRGLRPVAEYIGDTERR